MIQFGDDDTDDGSSSLRNLLQGVWFLTRTTYIAASEYIKYRAGFKSHNEMIKSIAIRLSHENMFYIKMFQAFAANQNMLNDELSAFFIKYTDNVPYTNNEYNVDELQKLEKHAYQNAHHLTIEHDYTPIHAGMMSVVFEGHLNHQRVVIKCLRKNIHKRFANAINVLSQFTKLTRHMPYLRYLNLDEILEENSQSICEQIDFRHEISNLRMFQAKWRGISYVKIPEVYEEYTTEVNPEVIIMEYINGVKVTQIQEEDREQFSHALARFTTKSMFYDSVYQADPHPGNVLFIKDGDKHVIGEIDYGVIGVMTREEQNIMYKMIMSMILRDDITMARVVIECFAVRTQKCTEQMYNNAENALIEMFHECTSVKIKCLGSNELYRINNILKRNGFEFKRSLYKALLTMAIGDSIMTCLNGEISFVERMADICIEEFGIDLSQKRNTPSLLQDEVNEEGDGNTSLMQDEMFAEFCDKKNA